MHEKCAAAPESIPEQQSLTSHSSQARPLNSATSSQGNKGCRGISDNILTDITHLFKKRCHGLHGFTTHRWCWALKLDSSEPKNRKVSEKVNTSSDLLHWHLLSFAPITKHGNTRFTRPLVVEVRQRPGEGGAGGSGMWQASPLGWPNLVRSNLSRQGQSQLTLYLRV